jgi:ribonucleoside-triphosphate reductase
MLTIQKIDEEILDLQKKLENVKGTKTEVYTRIVGYHRAVDNWNNGKKEEYKFRKTFKIDQRKVDEKIELKLDNCCEKHEGENDNSSISINPNQVAFYKMFTSQYCRNCPPVKDYMKNLPIIGEEVDVSTDLGINSSRKYNIMSTPTVVLFDENDRVLHKLNSLDELKKIFS